MPIEYALYTVSRCKKDEDDFVGEALYGPIHGSVDAEITCCGQPLNDRWYIVNNTFDGEITCKKCKKIMKNTELYHTLGLKYKGNQ